MNDHPTCKSCAFYKPLAAENYGDCRVNPPQIMANSRLSTWPWVQSTDWCGKFIESVEARAERQRKDDDTKREAARLQATTEWETKRT